MRFVSSVFVTSLSLLESDALSLWRFQSSGLRGLSGQEGDLNKFSSLNVKFNQCDGVELVKNANSTNSDLMIDFGRIEPTESEFEYPSGKKASFTWSENGAESLLKDVLDFQLEKVEVRGGKNGCSFAGFDLLLNGDSRLDLKTDIVQLKNYTVTNVESVSDTNTLRFIFDSTKLSRHFYDRVIAPNQANASLRKLKQIEGINQIEGGLALVGSGYNAIIGYPRPSDGASIDNGFTLYQVYDVPADTPYERLIAAKNCENAMSLESSSSASSFKKSVDVKANLGVDAFGAAFSVNSDFKSVSEVMSTSSSQAFSIHASCAVARRAIPQDKKLNAQFVQDYTDLIKHANGNDLTTFNVHLKAFVGSYGSHVIKQVDVGAQASISMVLTSNSESSHDFKKVDVEATVKYRFISASTGVDVETDQTKKVMNESSKVSQSFLGLPPVMSGEGVNQRVDSTKWGDALVEALVKNPSGGDLYPTSYPLMPLTDVIELHDWVAPETMDAETWKGLVSKTLAALKDYYAHYCDHDHSAMCFDGSDKNVIRKYQLMNEERHYISGQPFIGYDCPIGMNMTSNGISRPTSDISEGYMFYGTDENNPRRGYYYWNDINAKPFNARPMCMEVDVVHVRGQNEVKCPSGYLMSSCAAQQTAAGDKSDQPRINIEYERESVTTNPIGCRSEVRNNHDLTAACVRKSDFSEIVVQVSTNAVDVRAYCPKDYIRIGCAISNNASVYERFWAVFPFDDNSCLGYNWYGATVYAFCAKSKLNFWPSEFSDK